MIGIRDYLRRIEPEKTIKHIYQAADIFCFPSLFEGFGIVVLEAMAMGLPVVAFNTGPIPEIIVDGCEGFLAEPGSVPDLTEKLRMAASLPENNRINQNARRKIIQTFDIEKNVQQLKALYSGFLIGAQD